MTNNPMNTYGLMLKRSFEHGVERVELYIVSKEPDKDYPRGCSSDGENSYDKKVPKHVHGLGLDGLGMYGFVTDDNDPAFIGNEIEYRNVFAIEMPKINRMQRTMKRVLARLHKDDAREPGDRLVSLCKALKLSFVVERIGTGKTFYAENDWRWMTITEGRDRYRALIAEAIAATKQRKGIAA